MLMILRVRGASYRDIGDQSAVKHCCTSWVRYVPGLPPLPRGDSERCNRRLQLDVLPSSLFSTLPVAAFVFIRAAYCMCTNHINNDRITANTPDAPDAHFHLSARFLQNTDCLSDHCSATYHLAASKYE